MEHLAVYRELAERRGGELLSEVWLGVRYKLEWRCAAGHEWEALPLNVKEGCWCPKCGGESSGRKRCADNLARGRAAAAAKGGQCLATENGSVTLRVAWACAEGHQWETAFQTVIRGSWCPTCFRARKRAQAIADNLSAAGRIAAGRGGRCLAAENFAIKESVEWECAAGHQWPAAFYAVRRGEWCKKCDNAKKRAEKIYDNLTRARLLAEKRGGECLAVENFAIAEKVMWRCAKGHEWLAFARNIFFCGTWCPRCRNKSEDLCHKILTALFPGCHFARNDRSLKWLGTGIKGQPLELDMYSKELRLALEFNGFLHEQAVDFYGGDAHFARIQEHDARKVNACQREGVCLVTINFSDVSTNGRQVDLELLVAAIWDTVADMGYLPGVHLASEGELLAALGPI